jgi:hypothetical protein
MISCSFFGGLGNNLFQLANLLSIHKKYGYDMIVPRMTDRGNIGIYNQSTKLELEDLFENEFNYVNDVNGDDLAKRYGMKVYIHDDVHLSKTDYSYKEVPLTDNTLHYGYFQSEKYFNGIDISKELILNKDKILFIRDKYKNLFNKKTISLHYRLAGDRITQTMQHYHKNISVDYYKKALEVLDYTPENYNILVFSDNITLAKKLLDPLGYDFHYINNNENDNVLDFIHMSQCDYNIVGNSTYSWWSAYMNNNVSKKVVVSEKEYFGPGYQHFNMTDIFPSNWIKI